MLARLGAAMIALVCVVSAADAAPRHKHARANSAWASQCDYDNSGRVMCLGPQRRSGESRRAYTSGRPSRCPPVLWCGCFLATKLGFQGRKWRDLWVARSWARLGDAAPRGCIGCIAVFSRGRRGGHVGIVRQWDANGNPVILSGNVNNRVVVAAHVRRRLIALRWVALR
jgi:uncharacterized protein (TIGR02594 family)